MRIAVVNGLRVATDALIRIISLAGEHKLAWCAGNEIDAIKHAEVDPPDVIIMDLVMPGMNGVEAIRHIMQYYPCPVLIVTASVRQCCDIVFEAMGAGAMDAISMPDLYASGSIRSAEILLKKITLLGLLKKTHIKTSKCPEIYGQKSSLNSRHLVVIGCSSGGPTALANLLAGLPPDYSAPIVVIQHIDVQFAPQLARWLGEKTALHVKVATEGDSLLGGHVYVAANDNHLVMNRECKLYYTVEPHETYYRPSVDVFFNSVATHWHHPVTAILLTGMGEDGAHGLLELRRVGAYTIAQDEQTSAVYGMPKVAAELGAAMDILPLQEIYKVLHESAFERAFNFKCRHSRGA